MVYSKTMATKIERRRRLSKRRTRTHRKLKGVNIGHYYHDILETLAQKHGESANGSIRAQAEAAIVCYARTQGVYLNVPREIPEDAGRDAGSVSPGP